MASKKNPLRELTPTEGDLDDDKNNNNNNNNQPTSSPTTTSSSTKGATPLLTNDSKEKGGETLREKALKKLNGPDANPSQLGDPVSLKAETSDHDPTPDEKGAKKGKGASRL